MDSGVKDIERISVGRLNLDLSRSREGESEAFYPAGSLSSHRDSCSDSEDASQPAPRLDRSTRGLSEDYHSFQPTSDNIIIFEVCSPLNSDKDPDHLRPTPKDIDQTAVIRDLRDTVSRLQLQISSLKNAKTANFADKATVTSTIDEFKLVPSLKREIEHLTATCKRYERQNTELRTEIQHCASDLIELDKAKSRLSKELKKSQEKCDFMESEFRKIAEFVDTVLNRTEEMTLKETDSRHLSNYVSSKVEIIGSKYSRLLAAFDRINEENAKMKESLEMQSDEIVRQLSGKIQLKDKFIEKLEKTLEKYKEKMQEVKLEEDSEVFEDLTPKNRTENLSHKLREITEELAPFRSQHGSPERIRGFSPEPAFSFIESSPNIVPNPEETVEMKTDTPVKEKRLAWKSKQARRNVFVGMNFQSQLAVEKYKPVLSRERSVNGSKGKGSRGDNLTPKFCRQVETKGAGSVERKKKDAKLVRGNSAWKQ